METGWNAENTPQSQSGHRQAAALGRFADFFAKGSAADPVGYRCPVANRHVFAPRHGPLVWHYSLKNCLVKPINKSEILKAETLKSEIGGQQSENSNQRPSAVGPAKEHLFQVLAFQISAFPLWLCAFGNRTAQFSADGFGGEAVDFLMPGDRLNLAARVAPNPSGRNLPVPVGTRAGPGAKAGPRVSSVYHL